MANFWKNKNVLITGYEGFLGSNLTRQLILKGAKVVCLDIKVGRKYTILTKADYKKMTVIKGSVVDLGLLKGIISRYGIEIVFHLAAEALVGKCLEYPVKAFSSNIRGTWNVLEACRNERNIKAVIVASSDKAYGDQIKLPYSEKTPLAGRNPYDVSKSCTDLLSYAYFHTYGLPVAVTRCGNIYGPGDFNFSRIVPDTIRSAQKNKPIIIRSDGRFIRDYIYVDDVVSGYITLAQNLSKLKLAGEAFNFSNERPVSVLDLVKNIYLLSGKKPNYRILNKVKYEIRNQYLSARKARAILKWEPRYSLEEGLLRTIRWFREFYKKGAGIK